MSSLAVFPSPSLQDTITINEYNSNFATADPRECQPCTYSFGQVIWKKIPERSFCIYVIDHST
jgi:hypothetical protein